MFYDEIPIKAGHHRTIIEPSTNRNFNGNSLAGRINSPTLNAGLVVLRFSKVSGPLLLKRGGGRVQVQLTVFKLYFLRFQRGSNIFGGGGEQTFFLGIFRGKGQMLISIETYTTCDFPGGKGPDPLYPL